MHTVEPRLVILFGIDNHPKAHVCVRDATELGALAVENARFSADHPNEVVVEGDHVDLAGDLRDPEAVDDILRVEFKCNRAIDRDMQFVRGNNFVVGVPEFEPPLVPDGFHAHDITLVCGHSVLLPPDLDQRGDSDCEEDDCRDDCPRDLEPGVSMRLVGELVGVGPASVSNGCVDNGTFDEDKDDGCDPENELEQVCLIFSYRTGSAERGLGVVGCTCCQESQRDRGEQ